MQHQRIARVLRGLARGTSLIVSVTASSFAQQPLAGQYSFTGIASGNRPFSGVIHVTNANGVIGGRLIRVCSGVSGEISIPMRSRRVRTPTSWPEASSTGKPWWVLPGTPEASQV